MLCFRATGLSIVLLISTLVVHIYTVLQPFQPLLSYKRVVIVTRTLHIGYASGVSQPKLLLPYDKVWNLHIYTTSV